MSDQATAFCFFSAMEEHKAFNPGFIHIYLARYHAARAVFAVSPEQQSSRGWEPLEIGTVKLNFDASWSPGLGAGLGIVARDSAGTVLAWCRHFVPLDFAETSKALAARMAKEQNFQNLVLEGDCISVVNQLRLGSTTLSPIGCLIEETKCVLSTMSSCSFHFVRRNANRLAHFLASNVTESSRGENVLPPCISALFTGLHE